MEITVASVQIIGIWPNIFSFSKNPHLWKNSSRIDFAVDYNWKFSNYETKLYWNVKMIKSAVWITDGSGIKDWIYSKLHNRYHVILSAAETNFSAFEQPLLILILIILGTLVVSVFRR